jgi:hypothetical protein
MEKRVFLAIFLSFAVLAGYQLLFPPPPVTPLCAAAGIVRGRHHGRAGDNASAGRHCASNRC